MSTGEPTPVRSGAPTRFILRSVFTLALGYAFSYVVLMRRYLAYINVAATIIGYVCIAGLLLSLLLGPLRP